MRRIAARLEALRSVPFVFIIGLVAGAIQGIPRLFLGGTGTAPLQLVSFLIVGATGVLWWTAALLLWRVAVRRRQSSLWIVAAHVTLGLITADIVAAALGMVVASIDTHGEFAATVGRHLSSVVVSNVTFTLLRSPLWFVGSTLAIALGRHLDGGSPSFPATGSVGNHPAAVI